MYLGPVRGDNECPWPVTAGPWSITQGLRVIATAGSSVDTVTAPGGAIKLLLRSTLESEGRQGRNEGSVCMSGVARSVYPSLTLNLSPAR